MSELMDTDNDASKPPAETEPKSASAMESEAQNQAEATPAGIKSSPPPLPAGKAVETENGSQAGDRSDSEAETVVLQGVNGNSPSKTRKKIKLEDKANETGSLEDIDPESTKAVADAEMEDAQITSEGVTSSLGKRKRSKSAATRHDNAHTGNSSGLSSVPTSPVATTRSSLSKPADSESDVSKSPSPRISRREKPQTQPKIEDRDGDSDREREQRRSRRKLSIGFEGATQSGRHSKAGQSSTQNPRTRSTSPQSLGHRRSTSRQLSASSAATNGLSQKKRKIPAPLRSTKDQQSEDDSSTGESSRPRRSRTRNLATPPTGNSSASAVKMAPHKKKINHIGQTPFYVACNDGDLDKAKQLYAESPEDLDRADNDQNTPLQAASLNGHEDVVEFLLEKGCNIHCFNHRRDTPLLDAVENSHLGVVKLLLDAGVNPRIRNQEGEEPIDKIDEEDDDAEAIREALQTARSKFSHVPLPQVPTPTPAPEPTSARSQRTQSHGRSLKTGEHRLFTAYNLQSIQKAAASGDVGTVCTILDTKWPNGGFDDPETLVMAARGGHADVLGMIIGLGGADPDPPAVDHLPADQATPVLAAIGGDNIGVIELLVNQASEGRFDPTRKHRGKTYYEIAREREGPNWEEEEEILKKAYLAAKEGSSHRLTSSKRSSTPQTSQGHHRRSSDDRASSSRSKNLSASAPSQGSKRDGKATESNGLTPVKRGPGRPRKEGNEPQDRDAASTTSSKRERPDSHRRLEAEDHSEIIKPKRKLISGKDLKGERERQRRASFASMASNTSALDPEHSAKTSGHSHRSSSARVRGSSSDHDVGSDRSPERTRSSKGDGKERLASGRGDSPVKRARSSLTPPMEAAETTSGKTGDRSAVKKRRRLKNEDSPTMTQATLPKRENSSGPSSRRASDDTSRQSEDTSTATEDHKQKLRKRESPSAEEQKAAEERERAQREQAEQEAKAAKEQAEREAAEREKAEREAREAREAEEKLARQRAEEVRLAREAEEKRLREEALQREKEEAELRERQRREEAEAQRRAEEERRRRYEEQQRLQREEQERRRAAHLAEQRAERLRVQQAQEAARLAKLPPLLRWFEKHPQPTTPEFASLFNVLYGFRYDTIRPQATGQPDAKEQWVMNIQVALLLGEKDLQLSRYTAWERIPATTLAKHSFWRLTQNTFALFGDNLTQFNPENPPQDPNGPRKHIPIGRRTELMNEALRLYMQLDLFFVKVSDFMFIVPKFPHLQNIRLEIMYRELPPDESYMYKWTHPWKYKQDPDEGGNHGFAPNDKYYVNGICVGEHQRVQFAKLSKTPQTTPKKRAPVDGITEIFPGEPDYERLCREQGLEYLLENGDGNSGPNGEGVVEKQQQQQNGTAGVTPPESNASADADMHDLSSSSMAATEAAATGSASGSVTATGHDAAPVLTNGVLPSNAAPEVAGTSL